MEKRKFNEEQPNPPITQSRQRGAQTTSTHLHWCGANPPSSWPAHVAGNKGDPPKQGYIFAIFAGFFDTVQPRSSVFLRKSFLGQATGWDHNQ